MREEEEEEEEEEGRGQGRRGDSRSFSSTGDYCSAFTAPLLATPARLNSVVYGTRKCLDPVLTSSDSYLAAPKGTIGARFTCKLCFISPVYNRDRKIGAIGFHAFTPPSQPITLSDRGPMEPGEPSAGLLGLLSTAPFTQDSLWSPFILWVLQGAQASRAVQPLGSGAVFLGDIRITDC
ncbi:hypothetical protein EYF80_010781 [Liparis tanakae]|uniref:Uncharacterized protein n=1 Tax=Liparis tanakae TaxID=230148 RepID=A0A4Z2IPG0_9TELE|nr:hypothetical protein EYF80_010781 [Liparis tanakae]